MFKEMIDETVKNSFNVRDDLKDNTVEENKKIHDSDRLPFRICCLNIEGDLNIGTILRSASLLGCEKAYVFGRKKFDARSMVGVGNYMDIEKIHGLTPDNEIDVDAFDKFCVAARIYPIFIEQGGTLFNEVDWPVLYDSIKYLNVGRLCFVFGNEATGIPKELIQHRMKTVYSIPQYGVLRSYNVAASANIVMWDFVKQYSAYFRGWKVVPYPTRD